MQVIKFTTEDDFKQRPNFTQSFIRSLIHSVIFIYGNFVWKQCQLPLGHTYTKQFIVATKDMHIVVIQSHTLANTYKMYTSTRLNQSHGNNLG